MTINEAWAHLTSKRGWYKPFGIERRQAATLKRDASDKKKKQLLTKAGYNHTPEVWRVP